MVTTLFRCLVAVLRRSFQALGSLAFPRSTRVVSSRVPQATASSQSRTHKALAGKPAAIFLILGLLGSMAIVTASPAEAALVRAFTRRFGVKTTGDVVMIANSVLTCPGSCTAIQDGTTAMNNNNVVMAYIDADGAAASPLAAGGTIATFDSSSSSYTLPAGAKVLFAGLYWGGDSSLGTSGAAAPSSAARNTVLFKYP